MNELWKNFIETGSVAAYLNYKNFCTMQGAENEFATCMVQGVKSGQRIKDSDSMTSESIWGENRHGESYSDRHGDVSHFL